MEFTRFRLGAGMTFALFSFVGGGVGIGQAQTGDEIALDTIVITAEEQIKQALGVSTISARDLEKNPVVNDIAEIIRKQPGVNLTGNSPTGQRGNQRQIDIRGMGPENTLILIDGRPVLSRTAIRMSHSGERDTRGDSNWVPAELVERIEVIRGPAAARYGSGAAGGVVNIITKKPQDDMFSVGMHYNAPRSKFEGSTLRSNFVWAKPLGENLGFRLTGNFNKSEGDKGKINVETASGFTCRNRAGTIIPCSVQAGREGVVNKDFTALLYWQATAQDRFDFELGTSSQDNIYTGDSLLGWEIDGVENKPFNAYYPDLDSFVGQKTSMMRRKTASVTHSGKYDWGDLNSFLQYEYTNNTRREEGQNGSIEGLIVDPSVLTNSYWTDGWETSKMTVLSGKTEAVFDTSLLGRNSAITLGAEVRAEKLDLRGSEPNFLNFDYGITSLNPAENDPINKHLNVGVYAEGNIQWSDRLTLTPALRFDWTDSFGFNPSGSLNAAYEITPDWTIKGGIARAFKSPNQYQMSEQYVYYTNGNGCPNYIADNGNFQAYQYCVVLGNRDLKPETSINKEIGVAYNNGNTNATLTYFKNDYKDKVQSGTQRKAVIYTPEGYPRNVFQWDNVPDAVVSGLEGSLSMPLGKKMQLSVNGTYMQRSERTLLLDGGGSVTVPLSLVPKYTVNAALEIRATDQLTITPSLTHYGKIEAPRYDANSGQPLVRDWQVKRRDPYTLVNLAANYDFNNGVRLSMGAINIFGKKVLRSGEGANTFNESGRAFYIGLNKTF